MIADSTLVGSSISSGRPVSSFAASHAREVYGRQQVAAVCYRLGKSGLEFLLVRTRGGRWIFPKGGVEPGLTHAQSAALEAFEEAGVHGRIEEMPFARYRHGKGNRTSDRAERSAKKKPVIAHLCEVSHLEAPQEAKRKPTWFSPEKAKRRLLDDRASEFGDELANVVDRAVSRIRRMHLNGADTKRDTLLAVRLEAFETMRSRRTGNDAAFIRYFLLERRRVLSSGIEVDRKTRAEGIVRKVLQLDGNSRLAAAPLRLTAGARTDTNPAPKIAAIDRRR